MRTVLLYIMGLVALPATAFASQGDLQSRFDRLQAVARSGVPAFQITTANNTASLFDQRSDGIVRLPAAALNAAADQQVVDVLMLVALSAAANNPQKPATVSGTVRTIAGVAAWVGSSVAESNVRLTGRDPQYETTGVYQPENSADAPAAVNPVVRALQWAKASGGCEAQIVSRLNEIGKGADALASDARRIVKALGPIAWSPDTRCL